MIRVKICGITREADAQAAADAGADAIGLVFHPASPRCVSLTLAASIVRIVGPFVTTVGLFVDAAPDRVREVLACTGIHLLQLHGNETPAYCAQFGVPFIKALRMAPGLDSAAAARSARRAILRRRVCCSTPGIPLWPAAPELVSTGRACRCSAGCL